MKKILPSYETASTHSMRLLIHLHYRELTVPAAVYSSVCRTIWFEKGFFPMANNVTLM